MPEATVQYPVVHRRLSYTISVLFVTPFSLRRGSFKYLGILLDDGKESEGVVGVLRLPSHHPGQAESRSLCCNPGGLFVHFLCGESSFVMFRDMRQMSIQEQASDPALRLKPKERSVNVNLPTR